MGDPADAGGDRRPYRVVGFMTGDLGLGVAARNTVQGLRASGRPLEEVTIQHRWAPGAAAERPPGPVRPGEVTLFHMNPPDIAIYRAGWRRDVSPVGPAVCVPFWELPRVPVEWEPVLGALDAVLAPTRFIAESCARAMPVERVIHYPQAVFVPDAVPAREAWGFPAGTTVFLASFDIGSDIDRKNPWAAVEAFHRAFPADADVRLVLKTKPWRNVPALRAQVEELSARVAVDARIRILDRSLGYGELMSLYASCDILVAMHRSEGLGLHLMEAMSLGKPVVATGWSGNMDFMTPENSVPVRYALVPVRTRHDAYLRELGRDGQVWAEADVAHAADELRGLHASPARRRALGLAAANEMEHRRRMLLAGAPFATLEAALPRVGARPAAFRRAVLRTRVSASFGVLRRAPRAIARRLGLART
ncbi:MAG TPA: glycosyltransferase family 4 protein [Anaeromyxobacter sp.]